VNRGGAPTRAPHSSVFARLASGTFYETIIPGTDYRILESQLFVIRTVDPLPKAGAAEAMSQNAGATENIGPPRVDNLSGNA
jgi:hypothetical protein